MAYAIKTGDGEILTNTIHEHARGAMVNWLWVYANQRLSNAVTDEEIRKRFIAHSSISNASLYKIKITEVERISAFKCDMLAKT